MTIGAPRATTSRATGTPGRREAVPLRILAHSVALQPRGGVEICTLQDSLALAARGHSIDVLYSHDGMLRPTYESSGIGLQGPYDFCVDHRHPAASVANIVAPARWARRQRADVLWLNRIEHLIWGQAVSRSAALPLVCHLHGPPVFRRMREVGRGVAHFIAVSDFVRDAYLDLGIEPGRITRVYNAIPPGQYPVGGLPERERARRQLGLPHDVAIVLCYGQLSAPKGALTLLEAWRQLWSRGSDAVLVLLDSAESREPAVATALRRLDPRSYRVFTMASDVVPFLHACDVVAFPTLLPETFGRVVLEGMASGRPVVASRVGAVPEILSGPMDRFLVRPGSSEDLEHSLGSLLDWREREPALGRVCADWVESRFPFSAHVDALESILADSRRRHFLPRPSHRAARR